MTQKLIRALLIVAFILTTIYYLPYILAGILYFCGLLIVAYLSLVAFIFMFIGDKI